MPHLERSGSRQLRRVLNATDPTAKIIIPAESMFVFNGTSADLAQQFYQRYQAGDALRKLDIPHKSLPATIQQRLATYKLKFKNLHSLLQRALIWDSGYVLSGGETATKLVKIYTANGTSMADIAVSYQEFTGVAGCAASNCSSAAYRSGAKCNGDTLAPVLKCASEDVGSSSKAGSSIDFSASSFWATGGNHKAIPELSIAQHTWEDSASNQTFSVNAIHSRALADENSLSEACSVRLPSMIIPCARYTDVSSSGSTTTTTTWGDPAPGKLVTVWLEHAHADRPGFSTTYMVLIVIGIIIGLVLIIVMCCKGQSRFKRRRQRRAEAKMTSADPQAFLDSSSDEVLAVSAVPLTPVHAILESDLESAPSSTSSEWNNAFVSHRAVAGKRLRMDQLVLKKQIATGANSEIWAAKYHGARVTVKKIVAVKTETQVQNSTSTTITHTPEFSAEIELLVSLRHRNIVRFYGVTWSSPDSLCVVTEYARKGNLHDVLLALKHESQADETKAVLTWDQIKRIMAGVASALQYLHARQEPIVHGNLRSKNVLLSSHFEPKLIGIGAAAASTTSQSESDYWRAPEVVQGAPSSLESDIYALGALFSELVAYSEHSQTSEQARSRLQQSEDEEQKQGDEPVLATSCLQAIKDIVAQCQDANPSARPRMNGIVQVLQQQ